MSTEVYIYSSSYTVSTTTLISLPIAWTATSSTKKLGSPPLPLSLYINTSGTSSTFVYTPVILVVIFALLVGAYVIWESLNLFSTTSGPGIFCSVYKPSSSATSSGWWFLSSPLTNIEHYYSSSFYQLKISLFLFHISTPFLYFPLLDYPPSHTLS